MTGPRWILLAEDNPCDADLALRALGADHGSGDVLVANDGSEALDCLYRRGAFAARDTGNPALVLLDLKMPKVDGLEVLRQLKAEPALRSIPVVVFSSSRQERDVVGCYRLGANAYVVKPVDFQQFVAVLQGVRAFWMEINEPPPLDRGKSDAGPGTLATAA